MMYNLIILVFVCCTVGYMFLLYEKRVYVSTLYWLGIFLMSFLIPNLMKDKYNYGYNLSNNDFIKLNLCYLGVLFFFILFNFLFVSLNLRTSSNVKSTFDYSQLSKASNLFIVVSIAMLPFVGVGNLFSGAHGNHGLINPLILKIFPTVVFGLNLTTLTRVIYSKNKSQRNKSIAAYIYALFYGVVIGYARRLVIFPIIVVGLFYVVIKQVKPSKRLIVLITLTTIFVVMPLMVSIRTSGLVDGVSNYMDTVTSDQAKLVRYVQMSTDVSWSYSVAAIAIKEDVHITPLTLLKPITILVPRSIWAEKPLPLSLEISRLLRLSDNSMSSVPVGIVGEAFVYFDFVGVIVMGVIWGIFTGLIDKKVVAKKVKGRVTNDSSILISIIFVVQIFTGAIRGDIATTILETEMVVLPVVFVLYLSKIKR